MHLSVLDIVFFSAIAVQLIYIALFLIAFLKKRVLFPVAPRPISIIICAHDEEQNLRELVPILLQQDYPEFEIIIIEDRCNDGTYDYLLQATKEYTRLKMVRVVNKPEHVSGKKFGLTLGIRAAKYDWVLLTDADCRPASSQWIKAMSANQKPETKMVLGFSPYEKAPGLLNTFIQFESLLTAIQFVGLALLGKPYMGVGRNLLYQKSLFLENKGFNNYLGITGGDDDLFVNQHATKKNTLVSMGSETLTFSKPKTSWREYYHQKLRHLSVGKHYKFSDKFILGLFASSWLISCLLVIPEAVVSSLFPWVLGAFLLRTALLTILFYHASKKLGEPFTIWMMPFLDFIFAFYYLVAGVAATTAKRIAWKRN